MEFEMIVVKSDFERQRLILKIDQDMVEADFIKILARLDEEIPKLKKGWVMSVDLRGLMMVDGTLSRYITEVQKKIFAGNAKKIGTLVDSYMLKVQLVRGGNEVAPDYNARRFDNEAEWEKYLSED
jgi:hypothetical protein